MIFPVACPMGLSRQVAGKVAIIKAVQGIQTSGFTDKKFSVQYHILKHISCSQQWQHSKTKVLSEPWKNGGISLWHKPEAKKDSGENQVIHLPKVLTVWERRRVDRGAVVRGGYEGMKARSCYFPGGMWERSEVSDFIMWVTGSRQSEHLIPHPVVKMGRSRQRGQQNPQSPQVRTRVTHRCC